MNKINVYMFHYGPAPLPKFVKDVMQLENVNLTLGPTTEQHEEMSKVWFYRSATKKKIYSFMSDYWRMFIFKKQGPGLYIDTSFEMVNPQEFTEFLSSFHGKNSRVHRILEFFPWKELLH